MQMTDSSEHGTSATTDRPLRELLESRGITDNDDLALAERAEAVMAALFAIAKATRRACQSLAVRLRAADAQRLPTTDRLARWAAEWQQRRLCATELDEASESLLADVGIDRADIPMIVRNNGLKGDRLERMLHRVGLDGQPDLIRPNYRYELQRTCATCHAARRCERWLDNEPADATWPAFCPNAYEFVLMTKGSARNRVTNGRIR